MLSLFPEEPLYPEGFSYTPDFIDQKEEDELLAAIANLSLNPMQFQGYEAKRKVASFGQDWSFEKRILSKGKDIPQVFFPLINKLSVQLQVNPGQIAELLVTEYPPGSLINWHRDAPPFDIIAGVSLLSDCIFKLRPHEKSRQSRKAIVSIPVRKRSLYIMKGKARSEWQHSTAAVTATRYSITVRTLINNNRIQQ